MTVGRQRNDPVRVPSARLAPTEPTSTSMSLSTSDLAGTNRTRVLQALADFGPMARADWRG